MPEKVFYGGVVKVGRVYHPESSIIVVHQGPWNYVGDKVSEVLTNMKMEWKVSTYQLHYHEFERGSSRWVIYVDVLDMAGPAVKLKETILKIYMHRIEPRALHFSVTYHPRTVNLNVVNLEDLLTSLLYRLPHIAEDIDRFGFANLMDKNYFIAYHDKELVTRIDVVFSHSKLPYKFVVAYHLDSPFLSVDLHTVAEKKAFFDTLVESILDEYWTDLTKGGERR
jgi:hypothetical protein